MDWHWTEPGPQRREADDWPTELQEVAHRKLDKKVENNLKETSNTQMNNSESAEVN
jgi:hypothetical protein